MPAGAALMEHDYYQVLGVEPTADTDTILKAYLRQANRFHPDRGGTHEQMLVINEAWEVLSDPESRRRHDAARASDSDRPAREAARADAAAARERAKQYPGRWADFEAWLRRLSDDASRASYGSHSHGIWHFPTVRNSYSGWAAIVLGGVVGALVAVSVVDLPELRPGGCADKRYYYLGGFGAMAGAWVFSWLHRAAGESIKQSRARAAAPPPEPQPPATPTAAAGRSEEAGARVLVCERCGQKLRVPRLDAQMLVTCKACLNKFWLAPDRGQAPSG
jgi:hypothetical protein